MWYKRLNGLCPPAFSSPGDALDERRRRFRQALAKGRDSYRGDARSLQHAQELSLARPRFQETAMLVDPADGDERERVGLEDDAYEDIGIDDEPHPRRGCTSPRA